MAEITTLEYQTLMIGILDVVKTQIISPNSSGSLIETRYISSEGMDDEQWLGALRDATGNVDIWLLTFGSLRGLDEDDSDKGATGTFNKPLSIVVDYFADYKQGLDAVGDVGSESVTNTEREFLKKLFAVDLAIEKKRGCLQDNIFIRSWDFRIRLRRFETATVHWASGMMQLEVTDLFLQ